MKNYLFLREFGEKILKMERNRSRNKFGMTVATTSRLHNEL